MQLFKNEAVRDTAFSTHDLSFGSPLFAPRYARRAGQRAFALSTSTVLGVDEFDRDYLEPTPEAYRTVREAA